MPALKPAKALLLDEPSLGLAPLLVESVFATNRRIKAQGVTIPAGRTECLASAELRPGLRHETADHSRGRRHHNGPQPTSLNSVSSEEGRSYESAAYSLQHINNALSIGSLYALMAVGLAMVFGTCA